MSNGDLDIIAPLSDLEMSEFNKDTEDQFGVNTFSSASSVSVAAENKKTFDVVLEGYSAANKIKVIAVIREVLNLGLANAKTVVETIPNTLFKGVDLDEAKRIKAKLEVAGAKVSIK